MKVSDLHICEVSACSPDTNLARAGMQMLKEHIGSLPVLDRRDRVIGIITDRDIALELSRRNTPAGEIYVDEVMCDQPATCSPHDDIRDALRLMARHEVRRLPVVDDQDRLEGIISIDDVICHAATNGDSKHLPHAEVIEAFCQITKTYQPETHGTVRARTQRDREEIGRTVSDSPGRSRRAKASQR